MSLWITKAVVSFGVGMTPYIWDGSAMVEKSLLIGEGAGKSLTVGKCNIIVGTADVPSPITSYYINVDGREYASWARYDQEFQKLVMRRVAEIVTEMGHNIDLASIDYFFAPGYCDEPIS